MLQGITYFDCKKIVEPLVSLLPIKSIIQEPFFPPLSFASSSKSQQQQPEESASVVSAQQNVAIAKNLESNQNEESGLNSDEIIKEEQNENHQK